MARTTPPNLERALSRVKAYVLRFPNGVQESDLYAVDAYSILNKKDRRLLVDIVQKTDAVQVTRTGKKGKEKLWFRHMKFVGMDEPARVEVFPEPIPSEPTWHQPEVKQTCITCGKGKPLNEFRAQAGGPVLETCQQCIQETSEKTMLTKSTQQPTSSNFMQLSPEDMLKLADQLRVQAEKTKKICEAQGQWTKEFEPTRRKLLQSHQVMTKAVDLLVEGMSELDKAMNELRNFKPSL